MSDDIVTLCRELQADEKQLGNDLLAQCLWDAADEIERLREQVAALNMVNWSYKEIVNEEYEDD